MTLRRRSFGDDAAGEVGLSDLLRRFDAIEDRATAASAAVVSAAAGLVDDTFLVAGPNSRPAILAAADYTTDEASDQVELTAALGAYAFNPPTSGIDTGPRVVVAAGLYKIDGTVTMVEASALVGVGRGTQFEAVTTSAEVVVTDYCEVGNFLVELGPGP